ncbi:hypothetical protein IMSHALPRED_010794 [Imshaugia aleurites]|uniref:DUF2470 domain-containing protein n=1 Tax=Imshaugia aleurites TaxID=172621 RepID=A0A8H3IQF7_9LECA|nr:hypothetical protein IMSHALPRED_010794 [Imshaugia aleurites]
MAEKSSKSTDEAAKQRIITHMNNDHQDSLIRYLQYYAQLSSYFARGAHLADISFNDLTILSSNGTPHAIPIKPAMTSWSEARPRVVAMDGEAVAGLGASDITVKKYKPPYGFMAVNFVACALSWISFCRRANFEPGSIFYDVLLKNIPSFANFCRTIQPVVLGVMVVVHTAETMWIAKSRLERHTVRMFSQVWWMWILSCYVEGVGSMIRFDECVREEKAKKDGMKH